MKDLSELVKNKIHFVPKDRLIEQAQGSGLVSSKKITVGDATAFLLNRLDAASAEKIVKAFGDIIGYTGTEIQDKLQITKQERQKWTKNNLLNVSGYYTVRAREYGRYIDCPVYDALQIITPDDIAAWRASEKPLTEKQKEGLRKSRETSLKNRTCFGCGCIQGKKSDLKEGLCEYCENKETARKRRRYWMDHKENYCILDTETTGLGYGDQVIEIAVIDLDGNVLVNTLCMPTVLISDEAIAVNGIDMKFLQDEKAPKWTEVYPEVNRILSKRTMLAFNADFDVRMIFQTCRDNNIEPDRIQCECLMHNAMTYYSYDRFVSLQEVAVGEQEHRALGDCRMCLDIIKQV